MSEHLGFDGFANAAGLPGINVAGDPFGGQGLYDSTTSMHGSPDTTASYWVAQTQALDCAEMSAADIIGQATGYQPSESEITNLAQNQMVTDPATGQQHAIYDPNGGTQMSDMPALLADYGVSAHYSEGNNLHSIESALDNGQQVSVSVDGPQIWDSVYNQNVPDPHVHDHAVVVTGVDEQKGLVYLNDSGIDLGNGEGRAEAVPISVFESSWGTSNDAMVTTDAGTSPAVDPGTLPVDPVTAPAATTQDLWAEIFGSLFSSTDSGDRAGARMR